MGRIVNQSNLMFDGCCPEAPAEKACLAIITDIAFSIETGFSVTTTGSQGGYVRVRIYSEKADVYIDKDWELCSLNTFVFSLGEIAGIIGNGDLQFIVQTSNDNGATVCDTNISPQYNTNQEFLYQEAAQNIELLPEFTPGLSCSGTLTHDLIFANGQMFDIENLSILESGNGYLKATGFANGDETLSAMIAYYCDGIFVGLLNIIGYLRMFDLRVEGALIKCVDGSVYAQFGITNIGDNTIPAGTQFDYAWEAGSFGAISGDTVTGTYTFGADFPAGYNFTKDANFVNIDCLSGSDVIFKITSIPATFGNFTPPALFDTLTFTP